MTTAFFVILLFDRDGYHSSVTAPTEAEVKVKAAARTIVVKTLVACTCPFLGKFSEGPAGPIKNVSLPAEYRRDFAILDYRKEEP